MRVKCIGNRGSHLPDAVLLASGNTPQSVFNVSIDVEYAVYGMALWNSGLAVLIIDDGGRPNWKPLDLFDVAKPTVPVDWMFGRVRNRKRLLALWGYPSLISDEKHHDDLIERRISALSVFLEEIDSSQNSDLDNQKLQALRAILERS